MTSLPKYLAWAAVALSFSFATSVVASEAADRYPNRPMRVVNPYAPGGVTDITARAVLPGVSQAWGQPVIVDNRPGAGTNIGTEIVVRANPDGYTLLATTSAIATNPSFYPDLSFKANRDLAAIVLMAETPGALAVQNGLPAKSIGEFVALARQQPGKLTIASAGTGTSTHLAIELLKALAKIELIHVPFKGGGGGVAGVMANQLHSIVTVLALVTPHHRAGRLRILAVTTPERSPIASEIPTFAEGGIAGYEATWWVGMFAPKATPAAIVQKWNAEINRQLRDPGVLDRFKTAGLVARGGSEKAFAHQFEQDTQRWAALIKTAGITIQP